MIPIPIGVESFRSLRERGYYYVDKTLCMDMALMTGIQRVAKENILSGLNNLLVCTAESGAYADCFGFTKKETRELLRRYGMELSKPVRDMYDGYRFGGKELYNPWSVLNYVKSGRLAPHWAIRLEYYCRV